MLSIEHRSDSSSTKNILENLCFVFLINNLKALLKVLNLFHHLFRHQMLKITELTRNGRYCFVILIVNDLILKSH